MFLFLCNVIRIKLLIFFHLQRLNSAIIYDRDFSYNFFGFKVVNPFEISISIWPQIYLWPVVYIKAVYILKQLNNAAFFFKTLERSYLLKISGKGKNRCGRNVFLFKW